MAYQLGIHVEENRHSAPITYETTLLKSDEMFQDFIFKLVTFKVQKEVKLMPNVDFQNVCEKSP